MRQERVHVLGPLERGVERLSRDADRTEDRVEAGRRVDPLDGQLERASVGCLDAESAARVEVVVGCEVTLDDRAVVGKPGQVGGGAGVPCEPEHLVRPLSDRAR